MMRIQMLRSFSLIAVLFATRVPSASAQSIITRVDSARHEMVIEAGPFDVPTMDPAMAKEMDMMHGDMDHKGEENRIFRFDWPVDGWGRGYRVEISDSSGAPLPRALLHHLIAINFDRRDFLYSAAQRLFGIGKETPSISLPGTIAVPMEKGERLGFYVHWHNDSGREIHGAKVRIIIDWIPRNVARSYTPVLPLYVDVNNEVGNTNTFDIPPGKSSKAFEFTAPVGGHIIALTGHMHDYGTSVRLEDAETGKVMVEFVPERDPAGKIISIPRKVFLFRPLRLRDGHHYRVVAEYDSPLKERLVNGAMANILGVFAPDPHSKWPEIDPNDPTFKKDIESLPLFVPSENGSRSQQPVFFSYSQRSQR
jgi:hypothetical protein